MIDSLDAVNCSAELLIAELADEFRDRLARGETPNPEEYAARHPELSGLVRGVLGLLRLAPSRVPALPPFPIASPISGVLGDYRIVREVGRGGMGVVYEAEQISLCRRVALKVLPFAALSDSRLLQRFKNEARAAAALDHPHVVKVHAVGEERGVHFLAMQFIDGRPLSDLIRERRTGGTTPVETPVSPDAPTVSNAVADLAPDTVPIARLSTAHTRGDTSYFRQVAEWGVQAAEALEHAHSMGVVHRDVKPGNLLLDKNRQIWVADFGLAKLAASDAGMTMSGDVLGTLRYMSPEQAGAKHGLVDHRTDIYALGATLYELLTLIPAMDGTDKAEILRKIAFDEPVALRKLDRSIPADMETVVLKCLAKEPAERYVAAGEVAADLRRFLIHEPIQARPPSVTNRVAKWVRRHRGAAWAGVATLAIATVVLGASTVLVWRSQRATAVALHDREVALGEAHDERAAALEQKKQVEATLAEAVKGLDLLSDPLGIAKVDGDLAKAEGTYRFKVTVLERALSHQPENADYQHRLPEYYSHLHQFLRLTRRMHDDVQGCQRGLTLRKAWLATIEEPGTVAGNRLVCAMDTITLGDAQLAAGNAVGAEQTFRAADELVDASFTEVPEFRSSFGWLAAQVRLGEGDALAAQGKLVEAEALYRTAEKLLANERRADTTVAYVNDRAVTYRRLADVLWEDGRRKEAGEAYANSRRLLESLLDESKVSSTLQAELAWLLAVCPDRAIRDSKRAVELALKVPKGDLNEPFATLTLVIAGFDADKSKLFQRLGPADETLYAAFQAIILRNRGAGDTAKKMSERSRTAAKRAGKISPEVRRLLAEAATDLDSAPVAPPAGPKVEEPTKPIPAKHLPRAADQAQSTRATCGAFAKSWEIASPLSSLPKYVGRWPRRLS